MAKKNDCYITARIQSDMREKFNLKFPYTLSRFIRLCVYRALNDDNFFNDVYFNTKEL